MASSQRHPLEELHEYQRGPGIFLAVEGRGNAIKAASCQKLECRPFPLRPLPVVDLVEFQAVVPATALNPVHLVVEASLERAPTRPAQPFRIFFRGFVQVALTRGCDEVR